MDEDPRGVDSLHPSENMGPVGLSRGAAQSSVPGPQLPNDNAMDTGGMGVIEADHDENAMEEDVSVIVPPPASESVIIDEPSKSAMQDDGPPLRRMSSDYTDEEGDAALDKALEAIDVPPVQQQVQVEETPDPARTNLRNSSGLGRSGRVSEGVTRARFVRAAVQAAAQAAEGDRRWGQGKVDDDVEQQRIQARRDRNRKFQAKKRKMHKEIVETLTAEAARYEQENARLGREIIALERKIEALRSGVSGSDEGAAAEALIRVAETRVLTGGGTLGMPPPTPEVAAVLSSAREQTQMMDAMAAAQLSHSVTAHPQAMQGGNVMYPGHGVYYMPAYPYSPMMAPGMLAAPPGHVAFPGGAMQISGFPPQYGVPVSAVHGAQWATAGVDARASATQNHAAWRHHQQMMVTQPGAFLNSQPKEEQ
mmetsp:Transcript_107020/g.149206  ORF Transcript_107020/g.149206 Transcript_107020/m.149206 type:complete len:422 (-) Transcript_107020:59-1324(-)